MGVNDVGWDKVLAVYQERLDRDGIFEIDAVDLKRISGREPRLMAKHDWSAARPKAFQQQGLSMLPLSRYRYVVGRFDTFAQFPAAPTHTQQITFPAHIESMDISSLSSESLALNAANIGGMFEDFLDCGQLQATLTGRMSSGTFDMTLDGHHLTVDRAQMEVDGGYESPECLVLVEAKNKLADDFNIRQLYYPYRRFNAAVRKPVIPLYLVYSNGVFTVYQYSFPEPENMRSIELVKSVRYVLGDAEVNLTQILAQTRAQATSVVFPQADSFERLLNLLELLPLSYAEISTEFAFTGRQAQYYSNALRFLGLADADLTPDPRFIAAASRRERIDIVLRALASRPVLREAMEVVALGHVPTVDEILGFMAHLDLAPSTRRRRASTVRRWMEWVHATLIAAPLPGI